MKIFTLSFDDGHPNDQKAAQIMKQYEIKGTFYPNFFRVSKIHKNIQNDFEIGSHGLKHEDLTKLDNESLNKIISRKDYEDFLNKKIKMFSSPWGYYNEKVVKALRNEGYFGIRTVKIDRSFSWPKDPFKLDVNMYVGGIPSFIDFKKHFEKFLAKGDVFHLSTHTGKTKDFSDFEKICKYIHESKIKSLTNFEILNEVKERIKNNANYIHQTFQSNEDMDALIEFAKKISGLDIVEFGTAIGKSCYVLASAAPDSTIYTIDPTPNTHLPKNIEKFGKQIKIINEKSEKVGKYFEGNIGLIFHDGVHTKNSIIENFSIWKNKILPGGYFLFHDYKLYRDSVGSGVDEIKKSDGWEDIGLKDNIYIIRRKK